MVGILLCLVGAAFAADVELTHSVRLTDSVGGTLSGSHLLEVRLYNQETLGSPVYSEAFAGTEFSNGYASVVLGRSGGLDDALFSQDLWIATKLDLGDELAPRLALTSVPRSAVAERETLGVTVAAVDTALEPTVDTAVCAGGSSSVALTLPGTQTPVGAQLTVKSLAGNTGSCSAVAASGETVDGVAALELTAGQSLTLQRLPAGSGDAWIVVGEYDPRHTRAELAQLQLANAAEIIAGQTQGEWNVIASSDTDLFTVNSDGSIVISKPGQLLVQWHLDVRTTGTSYEHLELRRNGSAIAYSLLDSSQTVNWDGMSLNAGFSVAANDVITLGIFPPGSGAWTNVDAGVWSPLTLLWLGTD